MSDLTRKQREILLFIDLFGTEWVAVDAARSAGVIVTAEDRGAMDWLVSWRYLLLYDDNRTDFAVGLTDIGRAALARHRGETP